jgi:2-methylcitrate dehydratase PrpD
MAAMLQPAAAPRLSISETLAGFVHGLGHDDIPAQVRERAAHLMLDAIGCALAAQQFDFAAVSLKAVKALAGGGRCTVIGYPDRLPMRDAAMVNGMLLHGLDYDDTHSAGIIHLTVGILPTLLALAEERGLDDGCAFLAAQVAALEAGARIASAARGGFHHVGFHPTGLVGTFAATLGAGKLDGLDTAQLTRAQGVALSVAAASLQFIEDGSWTKRLHPGWAAVGALTATALGKAAFPAPREAYEGRFGFYESHLGPRADTDLALATAGLGQVWETMAIAVKPFPLCHFVHAATDAAIALHRRGVDTARIRGIRVLVPQGVVPAVCEPAANKKRPQSDYDAKFSIPFCVAAGLLRGKVGLAELKEEALADPAILALAAKVGYEVDPAADFPRYYSGEVVVTLDDGREERHREHINRGSAERPISNAQVMEKYLDNATLTVSRERAQAIAEAVLELPARGVQHLIRQLAG